MAYNSTSTIAALYNITVLLMKYLDKHIDQQHNSTLDNYLFGLLDRIPFVSFRSFDDHVTLAPAKSWERINNTESPQLYPVYPWGDFGIGKPGLDTAINTWNYDTSVIKFRSHVGGNKIIFGQHDWD
jgi:hypothetical protein